MNSEKTQIFQEGMHIFQVHSSILVMEVEIKELTSQELYGARQVPSQHHQALQKNKKKKYQKTIHHSVIS